MKLSRKTFSAMGCPCELSVYVSGAEAADEAYRQVRAELDRLDRKYSNYRVDSELAVLEQKAWRKRGVRPDPETSALLEFADQQYRLSNGLFDITLGQLSRLWDGARQEPPADRLRSLRRVSGWHRARWSDGRLYLPEGCRMDLGGIVKEYAADRCAVLLRRLGLNHGFIDLGGDFHFLGSRINGDPWQVGIRDPEERDRAAADLSLSSGGLASSGNYERFIEIGGQRYSHIIDPVNGRPMTCEGTGFSAVSVQAPTCLVAGAVATISMLLGMRAGLQFLRASGLPFWCATPRRLHQAA